MTNILNHFFELFFPKVCICCDNRLVAGEKHLCFDCLYRLPKTDHLSKIHRNIDNKLEEFFAGRFPFVHIAAFGYFVKGGYIQKIIHEIKYRNNPEFGLFMGQLCGKEMCRYSGFADVDLIVPIPLHRNRLRKRGYNQSLLIAQGISTRIAKPVNSENLVRKIDNPTQTKNLRFERWKNTEGIFGIMDLSVFENKHILLIDDVITTGSTIETCAKLLLQCKNTRISIYAVGFSI